jgi:hypothetical protein
MAVVDRQRRVRTKGLENVELSWAAGQESMSGQICGRSTRGMGDVVEGLGRCTGSLGQLRLAREGSDDYFIPASAFVCHPRAAHSLGFALSSWLCRLAQPTIHLSVMPGL